MLERFYETLQFGYVRHFLADVLWLGLAIYVHRLYGTFVFALELTLARAKLAMGRRVKERRARIAQATEPNMCQQSSHLDRAGPGLSRPNPNHGWGSVVVVVGVEPTQARALGLA